MVNALHLPPLPQRFQVAVQAVSRLSFGVDPPADHDHAGLDVWEGTLKLPPKTVVPHKS